MSILLVLPISISFLLSLRLYFLKTHFSMQEWLEKSPAFALDSKDNSGLDSLIVLLKCLKIMENTTFLSKDNQV